MKQPKKDGKKEERSKFPASKRRTHNNNIQSKKALIEIARESKKSCSLREFTIIHIEEVKRNNTMINKTVNVFRKLYKNQMLWY